MKILSLFSGAGGADLALEAAGFDIAALCEIEPHARAVLREHWPTVPLHGDVCELDGTQYRGVDVVVGGSPCQDLSIAGKRAGLGDKDYAESAATERTRSNLFYEQVRIWNESGAPYLIWENVKGAFSSANGADFAAVLSAIVGTAIPVPRDGWRNAGVVAGPAAVAAWRLLDLQHFGVPQRRERIVVLAARAGGVDPAEVLALGEGVRGDPAPRFAAREGTAAGAAGGAGSAREVSHALTGEGCDASEDGTGRGTPLAVQVKAVNISDGRATLDDTMGTLGARSGGQEVGAQTRGVVLAMTTRGREDDTSIEVRVGDVANALKAPGGGNYGLGQNDVVLPVAEAATFDSRQITSKANRSRVELGRPAQTLHPGGLEVLTFDARGNGDGQVANTMAGDHQNRVTDYTALVVMASGQANAEVTEGISPTLTNLHEAPITFAPGVPRRLMPIECERLMGWPDDWTRWGVNEQGVRYELKDTPRYKLCGNGIGREWMEWVAMKLIEAVRQLTSAPQP